MKPWQQRALREIPPVNAILETPTGRRLLAERSRPLVVAAVGEALDEVRRRIAAAADEEEVFALDRSAEALASLAAQRLRSRFQPSLRRVINATGVVIHTNLGRAPLAEEAVAAIQAIAGRYNNLELDLSTGERGSRYAHVERLLTQLTGAEAAMVVNNNAAAVLLMLSALAAGREVVVSRGELVEIGGSFRVPEVITQGGARLVEVGTTNKTHPATTRTPSGRRPPRSSRSTAPTSGWWASPPRFRCGSWPKSPTGTGSPAWWTGARA